MGIHCMSSDKRHCVNVSCMSLLLGNRPGHMSLINAGASSRAQKAQCTEPPDAVIWRRVAERPVRPIVGALVPIDAVIWQGSGKPGGPTAGVLVAIDGAIAKDQDSQGSAGRIQRRLHSRPYGTPRISTG